MKEDNILTVETLKKAKIKMVDNETTKEKSVIISETEWLNLTSEVGKLERKLEVAEAALERLRTDSKWNNIEEVEEFIDRTLKEIE